MSDAFDKKLREKLSEGEVPFDPGAWKKMEKKLDTLNDDGSSRKPFWWWLAPLLLLLIGTGVFMWWRQATNVQSPSSSQAPAAASHTEVQEGKEAQQQDVTPAAPAGQPAQTASSPSAEKADAGKAAIPAVPAHPDKRDVTHPAAATGKQVQTGQPPLTGIVVTQPEQPATGTETDPRAVTAESNMLRLLSTLYAGNTTVPATLNGAPRMLLKEIKPLPEGSKQQDKKDHPPSRKGFSIGVMLGPVFNVAPSLQYGRIGVDAGLLLNYHVNNRWSFSTGAVYSMKPYGGTPGDYGVTKNWYPPTDPDYAVKRINANCNVLDIPLNINFTFMDRPNYTLSATAGISSYLMLEEKYVYKHQNAYDKTREFRNQNQHYFSVLNLAFTYQFPIGKQATLGIQPYAKVPLKEVGYGEVRLYSTGVAIQLNLNMRNRKR